MTRAAEDIMPLRVLESLLCQIELRVKRVNPIRIYLRQVRYLVKTLRCCPANVRGHVDGSCGQFELGVAVERGSGVLVAGDQAGELSGGQVETEVVAEAEGEGREVLSLCVFADHSGEVVGVFFFSALGFVAGFHS